jgi:hypothetical protein
MSLRRNNNAPATAGPVYAVQRQQQQQMGPYETDTGFALTSCGAIGFAQDVEHKLALANAVTQQQAASSIAQNAAPEKTPTLSSVVTSNRDAYARMQITCEPIMDNNQMTSGKATRMQLHGSDDESEDYDHTLSSSLFDMNGQNEGLVTGKNILERHAFTIANNSEKFDRTIQKRRP